MALFKTIGEIKQNVATFNRNMEWESLLPIVEQAELKYIQPLLGEAQYTALGAAYSANSLTAEQVALLKRVQRSLAYYVFYEALPFLAIMVGDMGVTEQQSREGTSAPARQFAFNQSRESALKNGDTFADALLYFLEKNADDYPDWNGSLAFTESRDLLLANTSQMALYLNIADSRRTYLALRPYIRIAETQHILPALGEDLFADLKEKVLEELDTPLTTEYAALLAKVRPALAYWTLYEAMPFLAIQVSSVGIEVNSTSDGQYQKTPADRARYETAMTNTLRNAQSFVGSLRKVLDLNIEDYPLYANDDTLTTTPNYELHNNRGKRSFMV